MPGPGPAESGRSTGPMFNKPCGGWDAGTIGKAPATCNSFLNAPVTKRPDPKLPGFVLAYSSRFQSSLQDIKAASHSTPRVESRVKPAHPGCRLATQSVPFALLDQGSPTGNDTAHSVFLHELTRKIIPHRHAHRPTCSRELLN